VLVSDREAVLIESCNGRNSLLPASFSAGWVSNNPRSEKVRDDEQSFATVGLAYENSPFS